MNALTWITGAVAFVVAALSTFVLCAASMTQANAAIASGAIWSTDHEPRLFLGGPKD